MPQLRDRVRETSTTTGTGNVTLAGAVAQFQTFNTAFGLNVPFYYAIIDGDGVDWEVGRGYLSASTTLVREVVHDSSNSGSAIDLSANTHAVFSSAISEEFDDVIGRTQMMCRGMYTL
jgi:hypothetical protein